MDYEPLQIKDSETSTRGGPPGWLAFTAIFGMMMVITLLAFIAGSLV